MALEDSADEATHHSDADDDDDEYVPGQDDEVTPAANKKRQRTPKPKKAGNKTPGKRIDKPVDQLPKATLVARLNKLKNDIIPKLNARAKEHEDRMTELKGKF